MSFSSRGVSHSQVFDVAGSWTAVLQDGFGGDVKTSSGLEESDLFYNDHDEFEDVSPAMLFCAASVMLSPRSTIRLFWDLFGLVFVCYDVVWTPVLLLETLPELDWVGVMGWITRLYWTLDMPAMFITGFMRKDGSIEKMPQKVARHYAKSWLAFDCFLVAMDWLDLVLTYIAFLQVARMGKIVRSIRLLKLLRLSRILKLNNIVGRVFDQMLTAERNALLLSVLKSIVGLMGFAHLMACVWHRIGTEAGDGRSWINTGGLAGAPLLEQYFCSLHWAMTQFLGEGTVSAQNLGEFIFSALTLVMAFVFSAIFVSFITTHMTRLQMIDFEQQRQFSTLCRYLQKRPISSNLKHRITRSAQCIVEKRQFEIAEEDVELFLHLSEPIRVDLHYEVYSSGLCAHSLFDHYCSTNRAAMKQVCHKAISLNVMSRGDVIFSSGERANHPAMLLVMRGSLTYFNEASGPQSVPPRTWVSEMVLWTAWDHKGSLRADEECELLSVDASKFQRLLGRAFHFYEPTHPALYAEWFVDQLNELDHPSLWDLDLGFDVGNWVKQTVADQASMACDNMASEGT